MSDRGSAQPSWSLALATIVFSIAVIYTSQSISQPRQLREGDIGLKAFPVGLSVVLLIGGLFELARCLRTYWAARSGRSKPAGLQKGDDGKPTKKAEQDRGTVYMLIALAGIAAYIISIPWIGFQVASAAFAICAMVYLRTSMVGAIAWALILIGIIHVLFVIVFKVQLPSGKLFSGVESNRVIRLADVDSDEDAG